MTLITIDPTRIAGVGNTRQCFIHPENDNQCIKIMKPGALFDVNQVEYDYYRYMTKKGIDMRYLPACHGFVDTTLGRGLVFDFIGGGKTLEQCLSEGEVSKAQALDMLATLEHYLLTHAIAYMDTKLSNLIVYNKALYIIDGLVPVRPRRLKIYGYIQWATRWKTADKVKKARKRVINFTQAKRA